MTTFAQVRNGRVLSHFVTTQQASAFPDIAAELIVAPDNVQDGWQYVAGVFGPYQPSAEEQRQAAIDAAIQSDTTLTSLKAMTNAEYDTWWAANVTTNAQAIAMLKRLVRVIVRRVL